MPAYNDGDLATVAGEIFKNKYTIQTGSVSIKEVRLENGLGYHCEAKYMLLFTSQITDC